MQQQWAPFIKTAPHEVTHGVGRLGHLVVLQCVELAVLQGAAECVTRDHFDETGRNLLVRAGFGGVSAIGGVEL